MIKRNRNLYVSHFDEINSECLDISDIWYEYYQPNELDYLNSIGFEKEWLNKNFLEQIPNEEMHVQYTLKNHKLLHRQITYIKCQVALNENVNLNALAFKKDEEVNSLNIFLEKEEYQLYNHTVFADENKETIKSLMNKMGIPTNRPETIIVQYAKEITEFYRLKPEFRIR